jgi:c-di-GMP-binding flagellar brake protein YcgR
MPNRRQHRRYDLALSADIRYGEQRFTATTKNLSAGGCCIESAYACPEDGTVIVELFLVVDGIEDDSMPSLAVQAHVQWAAEADEGPPESRHIAGLRFENATADQTAWLEKFLARVQPE